MSGISIRRATHADVPAMLDLLRVSMARDHDARFEALFRWKHLENAFGESPMWVAQCDGEIVGLRVYMRWAFERQGVSLRAVRAVDTATHPEFQGRGIFSSLTRASLEELADDGVDFVFNTPNAQSLPGYLKLGWHQLGRPAVAFRPTSAGRLGALRGARTSAQHWSEEFDGGIEVGEFLRRVDVGPLLSARGVAETLRTRLDASVLEWRYGFPELAYRVIIDDADDGAAVVRIRRRGSAREAVIALVLPAARPGAARRVLTAVRRAVGQQADYLLALGAVSGWPRTQRLGPMLTARAIAGTAPATVRDLDLSVGDVELF